MSLKGFENIKINNPKERIAYSQMSCFKYEFNKLILFFTIKKYNSCRFPKTMTKNGKILPISKNYKYLKI